MIKRILLVVIVCFSFSFNYAQYGGGYNYGSTFKEFGLSAGPVFFQSDYGERGKFENYLKNNGFNIGVSAYFTPNSYYEAIQEHFKIKVELNFMKSFLQHYGQYVEPTNKGTFATQLRGMRGTTQTIGLGTQIEYFPFKSDDYVRGLTFTPYISLGGQISYYTSTAYSLLGPLGLNSTTPVKYKNAYRNDSDLVASISTSIGTRYKLSNNDALFFDAKVQYFFSDWVDGLNPYRKVYTENRSNDWMSVFNIGYIYYVE